MAFEKPEIRRVVTPVRSPQHAPSVPAPSEPAPEREPTPSEPRPS